MARIIVPEAEALIDQTIPVLDKGFVRLVDYMGGDARVVQAARVSYGAGTKTVREDKGLINYLMKNAHTSPFEQVVLTFHMKLPIFVARQVIRHRTACLAGDAKLYFDLPGAAARGPQTRRRRHNVRMADFHRMWHEGTHHPISKKKPTHLDRVERDRVYTVPELALLVDRREETLRTYIRKGVLLAERRRTDLPQEPQLFIKGEAWHAFAEKNHEANVPMKARLEAMHLRMCDEATGEIKHTKVVDIWESGVKPVFAVTLSNGYVLKMSKDHRCLTEQGWLTLEQATGLRLRDDGGVTWNGKCPSFAVNGIPCHRDPEWLGAQRREGLSVAEIADRAGVSYHTIRKHLRAANLQYSTAERSTLSGMSQRGQRRTTKARKPLTAEALANLKKARSGAASNFWKGGVATDRENIGRWTTENASRVHEGNAFKCVICGHGKRLHAHHADPVWHNSARARDLENLVSLCDARHRDIHRWDLELDFLDAYERREDLSAFWQARQRGTRHPEKRLPTPTRLVRTFATVASIAFAGEEMTYDLEVAGPYHNFVADGFIVHNSLNEISGRYSVLKDEFYVPAPERIQAQSTTNKQGSGEALPGDQAAEVIDTLRSEQAAIYAHYEGFIEQDVARELARVNLPLSLYTEWYWQMDLHNLFHFLRLRLDWHAQLEVRVYAEALATCVRAVAPMCYEAFEEHVKHGQRFSRSELAAIQAMLKGEAHSLGDRALAELERKLWGEADSPGPST